MRQTFWLGSVYGNDYMEHICRVSIITQPKCKDSVDSAAGTCVQLYRIICVRVNMPLLGNVNISYIE